MSMVPRDPFEALTPLREAMNRLFEESFVGPRLEWWTARSIPVDVYESEDKQQYVIEAAASGFKPEEIQVTAEGDTVTIRAARSEERKAGKGTYMRRERYEGEMSRSVTLPSAIDVNQVQATYEHGVLTLRVPKAAGAKPKQIPIQVKEAAGAH
ncbi:MAG TPA: Hsp20/alpha crystallin family protein [Ktedonobacteraceae bacterium]|nr:Hsp20/alpha crystallin family protein [Ktedonobacteraceae bacterium]